MGCCHEPKLDFDLLIRLKTEAFEAVIELYVPKDSLRFYRPVTPVFQPFLAPKKFLNLLLEGIGLMIDLYLTPVALAFVTFSSYRTFTTIL